MRSVNNNLIHCVHVSTFHMSDTQRQRRIQYFLGVPALEFGAKTIIWKVIFRKLHENERKLFVEGVYVKFACTFVILESSFPLALTETLMIFT